VIIAYTHERAYLLCVGWFRNCLRDKEKIFGFIVPVLPEYIGIREQTVFPENSF
jgi:hypothetical protein